MHVWLSLEKSAFAVQFRSLELNEILFWVQLYSEEIVLSTFRKGHNWIFLKLSHAIQAEGKVLEEDSRGAGSHGGERAGKR